MFKETKNDNHYDVLRLITSNLKLKTNSNVQAVKMGNSVEKYHFQMIWYSFQILPDNLNTAWKTMG